MYEVLELNKNATDEDIRKAYKRLAKKHHPDKGGDPEKFMKLQTAFNTLSDPEQRRAYDESISSQPHMFASFFQNLHKRKRETSFEEHVSLNDLFKGCTLKVELQRHTKCPKCNGQKGTLKSCRTCHGSGRLHIQNSFVKVNNIKCPHCQDGKVVDVACDLCHADGTIEETLKYNLNIEPGTENGTTTRIENAGDWDQSGENYGDVIYTIKQIEHPRLKRNGDTLYLIHTISIYEAITGFSIKYVHLDDQTYHIHREKSTAHGTRFILPRMGMPSESGTGPLVLKIEVCFPELSLNIQQKTQLKRILNFTGDKGKTLANEREINLE